MNRIQMRNQVFDFILQAIEWNSRKKVEKKKRASNSDLSIVI